MAGANMINLLRGLIKLLWEVILFVVIVIIIPFALIWLILNLYTLFGS